MHEYMSKTERIQSYIKEVLADEKKHSTKEIIEYVDDKLKENGDFVFQGLLETFEGAIDTLELYLIETIKGYRILTQLAYDMNPRLPGLNKQAENN